MKLVGATNWFVRGPFMIEGLLCGLAARSPRSILLLLGKEIVSSVHIAPSASEPDIHALAVLRWTA